MKIFTYDFFIHYGSGQGIVYAVDEKQALELVKQSTFYTEDESITLTEIVPKVGEIFDFSWVE